MQLEVALTNDYGDLFERMRADVHDRHSLGMLYQLGYLKVQQANFVRRGEWQGWVSLYTQAWLEQLGCPYAEQLLADPAPTHQAAAIVGAILGELEAQVFQLLERPEGLASAAQWLAALLDNAPADFIGFRYKADLEALRSVVLWETRDLEEVSAVVRSFVGGTSPEERGPFSFWLKRTGQHLLQRAFDGVAETETLLQELKEELLPELKPDTLTCSLLDRISNWHARAITGPKGRGRQALQAAIGKTLVPKLNGVVAQTLKEMMQRACKEATQALQNGVYIAEGEVSNPTT